MDTEGLCDAVNRQTNIFQCHLSLCHLIAIQSIHNNYYKRPHTSIYLIND